jgi:hypothetical protein
MPGLGGALFSGIPWSIPIPLKDYPQIAIGMMNGRRREGGMSSSVKNHTFLSVKYYSLRVMWKFLTNFRPLFL